MSRSPLISLCRLLVCLVILNSICTTLIEARTSAQLKVKLNHGGVLVGRHWTSRSGRHMRAFLGVPYAKPPLGELRFMPPVPFGSWVGERLSIVDSEKCVQRNFFLPGIQIDGSEDCLYLNVYTPEEPKTNEPLPVMIWFHGGAFESGSGISSFHSPKYIMDRDIILVSANYRVGPLGFLSSETLDCPGNFGFKDQNMVLKWVQENIAAFGGNPKSVTVFGESAGGTSVTYHMISEKSKGLMHRGIAQSGTLYNPFSQPPFKGVAAKRARHLAQIVGCDDSNENWTKIVQCLRTKSAANITTAFNDAPELSFNGRIPFPPVVEPEHEEAFLSSWPSDLITKQSHEIPLIIGFNTEEGLLKTAGMITRPAVLEDFRQKFDQELPIIMNYDHHSQSRQNAITNAIKDFYLRDGLNFNKENYQNLTNIISDGWFIAGLDKQIRQRISDESSAPTYVYIFNHKGYVSASEVFSGDEEYFGACHGDDLFYIFPMAEWLFPSAAPSKTDRELSERLLDLWVNFASTGTPTPKQYKHIQWPAANEYPPKHLLIGSQNEQEPVLSLGKDYPVDRLTFWHDLNPFLPVDGQENQHEEL